MYLNKTYSKLPLNKLQDVDDNTNLWILILIYKTNNATVTIPLFVEGLLILLAFT